MEEIIQEVEQPTFKTMFAKLYSLDEYTALNEAIGKAKNYPDEKSDTFYYSEPNPTSIDGVYYMTITAEIQENFPLLLDGLDLVDYFTIKEEENIGFDVISNIDA